MAARPSSAMDNRVDTNPFPSQCVDGPAANASLDHQVRERRRVKEILRYFQPFQPPVPSEGKPRIATDAALTALAQLAALRLNCQRGFISLIDNTNQYIVAEATQTISLTSEDVYEKENDELSFGQTVLDFRTGVCPGTMACFNSPDGSLDVTSTYIKASRSHYVINDMSMLDGYKGRSYVRGWPYMKYYAEVAIQSPSGTCIGTLCVVDDKPRDGVDLRGIRILGEISNIVMNHLELCVSRIQQNRAERMIQGLGHFVEGNFGPGKSSMEAQATAPGILKPSVEESAESELSSELEDLLITRSDNVWENVQSNQNSHGLEMANRDVRPRLFSGESTFRSNSVHTTTEPTLNTQETTHKPFAPPEDQTSILDVAPPPSPEATKDKMSEPEEKKGFDIAKLPPDSLEGVLFRAANLIREAVALDGVVFFDPRSTNDGRLLTDITESGEGMSRPAIAQNVRQDPNTNGISSESHQILSKVMSCSTKEMQDHEDQIKLPEKTLQILLKQFPHGGVVTLDNEGIVGLESLTTLIGEPLWTDQDDISPTASQQDSFIIDTIDMPDANLIHSFPGVTSLMVYSFWDAIRDQCVAHCIAWTSEPARVFRRQDFTYIASFSNSVIAELSRLETVAADKAKSTFISSISHELRSPLHGIMASMEILRDLTSDASFQDLFGTIESCGSTLLDTIDNVLAYSQVSRQDTNEDGNLLPKTSPSTDGAESAVDLEILVEEVTSLCLTGVHFRMIVDSSVQHRLEHPRHVARNGSKWDNVITLCDISPGDWLLQTDRAVWKRILLNLVGNALKYTSSGSIVVSLRQEMAREDCPAAAMLSDSQFSPLIERDAELLSTTRRENLINCHRLRRTVCLSVKDSGKGMSQDYLTNHLFKPFHQENPLAPGTGLGLSIVERLVRSIGGKINVTSEEGVGTEVTVEVLLSSPNDKFQNTSTDLLQFSAARLGIFGLNPSADFIEMPTGTKSGVLMALASIIDRHAAASNLVTTTVDSIGSSANEILLCHESHYRLLDSPRILALRKPVIVLCMEPLRTHEHMCKTPMNVVLLSNPFGPRKFQRIIDTCLRIRDTLLETSLVEAIPDIGNHPPTQETVLVPQTQTVSSVNSDFVENTRVSKMEREAPSLLLVEDNPINLKLLVTSINRLGLPFMTATNGIEAVQAYKASPTPVLLVFMDIQMPMMDGMQASREIRSYEKKNGFSRSVIVALTAQDSAEAKQAAVDSGVDLFFTKPVSVKKLKEIITQYYI